MSCPFIVESCLCTGRANENRTGPGSISGRLAAIVKSAVVEGAVVKGTEPGSGQSGRPPRRGKYESYVAMFEEDTGWRPSHVKRSNGMSPLDPLLVSVMSATMPAPHKYLCACRKC